MTSSKPRKPHKTTQTLKHLLGSAFVENSRKVQLEVQDYEQIPQQSWTWEPRIEERLKGFLVNWKGFGTWRMDKMKTRIGVKSPTLQGQLSTYQCLHGPSASSQGLAAQLHAMANSHAFPCIFLLKLHEDHGFRSINCH